VSEVLDIAHLDSGLLQRRESTFSLNEFVDAKCRDLATLAEAKSLHLRSETTERIVCVRTDRIKLDRILTNLVMNAIKFTADAGITVSVAFADDGAAVIRVRDTGVGMAASEFERIFDEFAQLDLSVGDPNRGGGPGLAICRRLANFIAQVSASKASPARAACSRCDCRPNTVVNIAPVALPGSTRVAESVVRLS
jgi:signal transduction histidine kinase